MAIHQEDHEMHDADPQWQCGIDKDAIKISHSAQTDLELKNPFMRTVRALENTSISQLPPGMGSFSLYKVPIHVAEILSLMAAKGGVFIPMYRKFDSKPANMTIRLLTVPRERGAMWIRFTASRPFMINVFAGGVNAISGQNNTEDLATKLRLPD